jgi:ABC-2 type transport system ATP-binding protein
LGDIQALFLILIGSVSIMTLNAPSQPMIVTRDLTRDFKNVRAVNKLNLSIPRGELFGLVGPDGAGKTTTLRLLAGLVDITQGTAHVAGYDLARQSEPLKSHIGYMAQQFSLYGELTVLENLEFFAALFDVVGEVRKSRVEKLLAFARLQEFRERRAVHLSGGMQKKLALACTLINEPEVLLLDEPTTGVDPVSRREFWDILTDLHVGGTTIIVSTPYMDEAERCSRVGLMYLGEMMICDEPNQIRDMVQGELIEVRTDHWQKARQELLQLPGVIEVQIFGESLRVFLDSSEKRIPTIQARLENHGIGIYSIRKTPPRMEEAFISLIRSMEG